MLISTNVKQLSMMAAFMIFFSGGLANAQTSPNTTQKDESLSPANLAQATEQYQSSSQELLRLQENEVNKATAKLEELRQLVAEGLIAKAELEAGEQSLVDLRKQMEATQQRITDSAQAIARLNAVADLAKARESMPPNPQVGHPPKSFGNFTTKPTILRYQGIKPWTISSLGGLQTFFYGEFGHALPTSAIGQSGTHNRLGYDHRNAVDVALHPDTVEGKALISYLQDQGIPFLAFRSAVPGVATGPHIHVGSPSHRL